MSKLQKYNRIVFAIISIPTLFVMCIAAYLVANETILHHDREIDRNNGSISKVEAEKNSKKREHTQYISYNDICVLNSEKQEFVVPVIARTMEKPERHPKKFGFYDETVDEVVFEEDAAPLGTMSPEYANAQRVKKPDTAFVKKYYTDQFVNLVYESDAGKIHKTIFDKRFTGWDLAFIRNGHKRYLAFIGTENDTNNDGYLNQDDHGNLYLYDIDEGTIKVVQLPNMELQFFYMLKNSPILIFAVRDLSHEKTRKSETFIYRYNLNTGVFEDIIPDEEKAKHLKLIQ